MIVLIGIALILLLLLVLEPRGYPAQSRVDRLRRGSGHPSTDSDEARTAGDLRIL